MIKIPTSSIFKTFKVEDEKAVDRLIALEETTQIKHVYMDTQSEIERKKQLLKQKIVMYKKEDYMKIYDSEDYAIPINVGKKIETFFIKITFVRESLEDPCYLNIKGLDFAEVVKTQVINHIDQYKDFDTDTLISIILSIVSEIKSQGIDVKLHKFLIKIKNAEQEVIL